METTVLAEKKDVNLYTALVTDFMKNQKLKVSDEEKNKFIMLCLVNKLNPRKKEVYAIPYGDKLTLVIAYNVFLQRAEETGLLAGWNILMKKENGKLISGKITITRKDRSTPFTYELDFVDAVNSKNPLWQTKGEDMLRKQLIRIGFSLAFPKVVQVSDPEEITEDRMYHEIEKGQTVPQGIQVTDQHDQIQSKYQFFIDTLLGFLPEGFALEGRDMNTTLGDEQADAIIKDLQRIIYSQFKEGSLKLTKDNIKEIFVGDDDGIKKARTECLALLKKNE